MVFSLEFSADAEHDFELIFDHLLRSYLDFGESLEARSTTRKREPWKSVPPRSAS